MEAELHLRQQLHPAVHVQPIQAQVEGQTPGAFKQPGFLSAPLVVQRGVKAPPCSVAPKHRVYLLLRRSLGMRRRINGAVDVSSNKASFTF